MGSTAQSAAAPNREIERGYAALRRGAFPAAAEDFAAALATAPDEPRALQGLGQALGGLGHQDESLRVHRAAAALAPDSAAAQVGLGVALMRGGDAAAATEAFLAATCLAPMLADGHANLSLALLKLARPAAALDAANAAIVTAADGAPPWRAKLETCRANCLRELGRVEEARRSYDRALALDPDLAEAHVNRGTLDLAEGRFAPGWAGYEWRWRTPDYGHAAWRPATPAWRGEALDGRTLLLTAEQGLGDTIQFVRYAPLLAARGARVLLACQPALARLLAGMAGLAEIVALPEGGGVPAALPAHDCHAPLMSLPHLCATEAETVPAGAGYLAAPTSGSAALRSLLERPARRPGPRAGLVWAGNPRHANDRNRSLALDCLAPLVQAAGQLYALQLGGAAAQRATVPFADAIIDLGPVLADFADTAAALSDLDAVVTVDTAVAHLSGALGRPTLLLLPASAEWRWGRSSDATPWYDSIRLFRQSMPGDWREPVARVAAALGRMPSGASGAAMQDRVAVDDGARL